MTDIEVKKRDVSEDVQALRKNGVLPGVYYGRVQKSTPISIPMVDFEKVWHQSGESTIITLKSPEGNVDALISEVDLDPITSKPRHVDFYVFEEGRMTEVEVPLEFIGVSPAIKEKGAVLVKVIHELSIEADPRKLPSHIDVDISTLVDFDSLISVADLKLPEGVTAINDPEDIVASVYEPKEEAEQVTEEVDLSSIEVEKKGKADSETETDSTKQENENKK